MAKIRYIHDHGAMAEAIDELMAALAEPGLFAALVHAAEPAAVRRG